MIHKKIVHHFLPHHHLSTGERHRAHALSIAALFVYLQILVVVWAGIFFIRTAAPHILGTASYSAQQIVELTNKARANYALPPLVLNQKLAQAAGAKASDMLSNNYWAHNSPGGRTPWAFITEAGYNYIFAGENLARDFTDAESVVAAWMKSPTHRLNILDKNFKEIGIAVSDGKIGGKEGILVVQMFGAGSSTLASTLGGPNTLSATDLANVGEQATVLASQKFVIGRGVSLSMVFLIFALFVLEVLVTTRRDYVPLRSGVIAHLGLLAFVLFAVWYSTSGAVI